MPLDGLDAEREVSGDLLVGLAPHDEFENLALAVGERVDGRPLRLRSRLVPDELAHRGVDVYLTPGNRPDRGDEVRADGALRK